MSRRPSHSVGAPRGAAPSDERSPSEVLAWFREAGKALRWPEIRARAGVQRGEDADRLRRVLRGLCHAGELHLDSAGAYHVSHQGSVALEGRVTRAVDGELGIVDERGRTWPIHRVRDIRVRRGDRVRARVVGDHAIVAAIVEHGSDPVIGRLLSDHGGSYVAAEGPDYRGRVFIADEKRGGAADGDVVGARVLGEESYGLVGEVVERIARGDDMHVASTTLLYAHAVPTTWSDAVFAEVAALPHAVPTDLAHGRRDLRELPFVTIDGEDAKDFDDAVYCAPRSRGGFRLVVAIADVAHYVTPGSALDVSARERGNSVYLPDRVVPMLPEALSNDLCSLKPDVPRLTIACDMKLSSSGRVTGFEFCEALIHSRARLTYTRVAAHLAGADEGLSGEVRASLAAIHALYLKLRADRESRGALDFEAQEQKLVLENGLLARVVPVERNDAHKLIEEAMITANVCAAKFLAHERRRFPYRIHEGPSAEKFEDLRQTLAQIGIRVGKSLPTPAELKRIVDTIAARDDHRLLETLVLRSMSQAVYSEHNRGHFGLALSHYAHFTSPIRRYADLLVHRSIKSVLRDDGTEDEPDVEQVSQHVSYTERRADDVTRAVADWLKCEFAAGFVGDTFDGTVVAVTHFGLFVELERVFVQGLLHISNLGNDYFEMQVGGLAIVGVRSGKRFVLGERLSVVLADVDIEQRKVDLLLTGHRRDKDRGRQNVRDVERGRRRRGSLDVRDKAGRRAERRRKR